MVGVVAIAMVSWDLRVRQAAEEPAVGRPERLSFLGNVREASLSPDGSLLAYVTADPDGYHLWVEDAPGAGRPIPLATSERIVGIAWTSGGTQISYAEGPADRPVIRMISRLGGNGVIVGTGRGILSPDGKLVVVATGGDPNVMVVRRAENDTTRLRRPGEGWLNGIAWAPTSDRLVLAIMASDKSSTAISTLGLDGSVKPLLVETRPAYGPIWTPNGQSIYYVATTGSGRDVMRLPVTGGPPTTVAADIAVSDESRRYPTGTFLSIDANEERAVFVEEEQWSNLARFALDVNGGPTKPQPTLFTMGTALYSAARLSPDATQLAVFVSTSRGKKLGTVAIDGNQVEDIAVVGMNGQPAWSPDGSMIAYTGRVGTAGVTLAVYERASGVTRRPNDPTGLELTWAGSDIIVQRPGNHGLNAIDPSALTMTPLAPHDPLTTTFSPRAAPNGNLIAMTVSASGNGPVSFAVLDRATGATRVLLNGAYRPVGWSPDSKTVYAVTNPFAPAPEELLAVPLNGQPPRRIATLPPGYYSEDLSPDGRLLIASQVQTQSDTWQIRLKPAR